MGRIPDNLKAIEGYSVQAIEQVIDRHRPTLVVVDSIQSISDPDLPQATGSLVQVRSCLERLTKLAKLTDVPVVLVGHVTKDGDLAGPAPSSTLSIRFSPSMVTVIMRCAFSPP